MGWGGRPAKMREALEQPLTIPGKRRLREILWHLHKHA